MQGAPLELQGDELARLIAQASAFVCEEIGGLSTIPSSDVSGAEAVARTFKEGLPAHGRAFTELLERLRPAVRKSFNTAGPGYLAFIPGGGIMSAAIADFISLSVNRYVGVRPPAPALAQIEQTAVSWLAELMGYPKTAGGILTSGGSISTLVAIATAREAKFPGHATLTADRNVLDGPARGVIYISTETHYCVPKAARLAGFRDAQIRRVAVDERGRLDLDALRLALDTDTRAGLRPFLVIPTVGTTNTGAIDPLPQILDIARKHDLWVHADAAYGGFFRLASNGPSLMPSLEESDSITLDPHKGMFLPYGTGCLLVRDPESLRRAHAMDAEYLHDVKAEEGFNYSEISPELSRDFRGLRIWLPLMLHGANAFRTAIEEKLTLTRFAYDALKGEPLLEFLDEPQLSVVAFRVKPRGSSMAAFREADRLTEELHARVNARGRVFLSSTRWRERYVLRICVLSFRTHEDRVHDAVTAIREELTSLAWPPNTRILH